MAQATSIMMRKVDVANAAGVCTTSVTRACRGNGALAPAIARDRKRLYRDHPAVLAYIAKHQRPKPGASVKPPDPAPEPTKPRDPFAEARQIATLANAGVRKDGPPGSVRARSTAIPVAPTAPVPARRPTKKRGEKVAKVEPEPTPTPTPTERAIEGALDDFYWQSGGALPENLKDLGNMTLRQVAEDFGTLPSMRDVVRSLKDFADMQLKEQLATERRGDLIEASSLTTVLLPLIDLAFKRLVGEAPQSLREQIVARVLAGGDDLKMDVEDIIRGEIGGILEDCKSKVLAELKTAGAK